MRLCHRNVEDPMSKAQTILQPSDGITSSPEAMMDGRSASAATAYGGPRDESLAGQPDSDDWAGQRPGTLLSAPAMPKGRRSLFRR